ncbi:MAG: ABC transporter permease subunit [Thermoleophilia bacterium]
MASSTDLAAPAVSKRKRSRGSWLYPLISVAAVLAFLILWYFVALAEVWKPLFVPRPSDVWEQFIRASTTHDGNVGYSGEYLWQHLWSSMSRLFEGLALGILIGVPLGIALGASKTIAAILHPGVTVIRSLPPLAYFSLLIIWFGIGDSAKVVLLFLAAVAPIAIATADAVGNVPIDRLLAARSLGANRLQTITEVILPSALPEMMTGLRVALGVTFTTIVAAETVNGLPGIGGMVRDAQRYNKTDVVVLGIIVIGIVAVLLDIAIRALDRRVVPWRGRA